MQALGLALIVVSVPGKALFFLSADLGRHELAGVVAEQQPAA